MHKRTTQVRDSSSSLWGGNYIVLIVRRYSVAYWVRQGNYQRLILC